MQMRLGFGVAAFLSPDVLLVDEVLAVGDASFQQRCLDRIRQVLHEGATLLFVSHDLAAVEATCNNGVWLHNGVAHTIGPIREVLSSYRASVEGEAEARREIEGLMELTSLRIGAPDGGLAKTAEPLEIELTIRTERSYRGWLYLGVSQGAATPIFLINPGRETMFEPGGTRIRCSIPTPPLPRGRYYLWGAVYEKWTQGEELIGWQPLTHFDMHGVELDAAPRAVVRLAPIYVESDWQIEAV
jgi:hypothetical protein